MTSMALFCGESRDSGSILLGRALFKYEQNRFLNPLDREVSQAISTMNRSGAADDFKVLGVSILEDQNSQCFMACQDGFTLFKITVQGLNIKIPYRTIFLAIGDKKDFQDLTHLSVNLEKSNHRFLTFFDLKPCDRPITRVNPLSSDDKKVSLEQVFNGLNFNLVMKNSNSLRLVKEELLRQDFLKGSTPAFIRGPAYVFLFNDLLVSTGAI